MTANAVVIFRRLMLSLVPQTWYRRHMRFSITNLILFVLAAAIALGWYADRQDLLQRERGKIIVVFGPDALKELMGNVNPMDMWWLYLEEKQFLEVETFIRGRSYPPARTRDYDNLKSVLSKTSERHND